MPSQLRATFLATCLLLSLSALQAQDTAYARSIIASLCKPTMDGRGYANLGAFRAGKQIKTWMDSAGCTGSRLQPVTFPANLIKTVSLNIGGRDLQPGKDYLVDAGSATGNIRGKVKHVISRQDLESPGRFKRKMKKILRDCAFGKTDFVCIDTLPKILNQQFKKELELIISSCNTILNNVKLTYTVATSQRPGWKLELTPAALAGMNITGADISLQVQAELKPRNEHNVIGIIPGRTNPDSFMVICAHYDHLGRMGSALFPGANDNAAGVAMLLDMARYYSVHPHAYTLVFIAFTGEEAGLFGSYEYVQEPFHPLSNTRFVLNLDLVGTGETGMTVVNATAFPDDFQLLDSLNRQFRYLPEIRKRGKAANSDHHFFTEAGIPSFFWYQSGPRTAYHDVDDIPETLSLAGYNGTFRLAVAFLNGLH